MSHIQAEIEVAKKLGFKIAAHIGETRDSISAAGPMLKLTDRIGHGTFLVKDQVPFGSDVPFELCPTSNVINKTVDSYQTHHFGQLYRKGHPLVICTGQTRYYPDSYFRIHILSVIFMTHK